jgi:hypothetical protein
LQIAPADFGKRVAVFGIDGRGLLKVRYRPRALSALLFAQPELKFLPGPAWNIEFSKRIKCRRKSLIVRNALQRNSDVRG